MLRPHAGFLCNSVCSDLPETGALDLLQIQGRISSKAHGGLFSLSFQSSGVEDHVTAAHRLPCDSSSRKLLIGSTFTLYDRATRLTTLEKRLALRGTPASDVYFTFCFTRARGTDIKGENEIDSREKVAACRLKIHWKRFRNHKFMRGEMGERFLYFWQHHLCRWPALLMLTSAWGAVGDRAILQSPHIWAEWELVTLPGFCYLPAMPLAGVTRLRHFPTLAYRSWAKQGQKSCAQKATVLAARIAIQLGHCIQN